MGTKKNIVLFDTIFCIDRKLGVVFTKDDYP